MDSATTIRSIVGKMEMSASVYCSPQRYGPDGKSCRSELITFKRVSSFVDSSIRCVGDGHVSKELNKLGNAA